MKKLIILSFLLLLTSCFSSNKSDIEKAKEEIFSSWTSNDWINNENTDLNNSEDLENSDTWISEETVKSSYKVEKLIDNDYINIKPISNIESEKNKFEINWEVNNSDIDKIVVNFSNSTSKFPKDTHTLSQFKKWDKTFLYRAFRQYEVLDYWVNDYKIDAYIWGELVSSVNLSLEILEKSNNSDSWNQQENKVWTNLWNEDDNLFLSLPIDESTYWKPVMTSTSSFTYSLINWLEFARNETVFEAKCEDIESYISNIFSIYYWNTCRPVQNENWIYVNVLSISWENYNYERLYLDKKHWLSGKILLETWTWVTKENISEKNTELKGKNFEILTTTDSLFNDLLK